jgi:tetratricopeptide (TPR) repeat protein
MNLDINPDMVECSALDETPVAVERGELGVAEEAYRRLLLAHPDDGRLWLAAGRLAMQRGDAGLAEDRLVRSLQLPGTHIREAWKAIATARMHRGRFPAAGHAWWRAVRLDRRDTSAWAGLAVCAHRAGRERLMKRVMAVLEATTSRQQRRLALAHLWPHAVTLRMLDAELVARPTSPLASMMRQSVRALRRQVQQNPTRADAHYHLAVGHDVLGQREPGRAAIEAALRINPHYAAARAVQARLAA